MAVPSSPVCVVLACLGAAGCRGDSKEPSAASREAAAASVPADPDAPPARPRIVAFGDSLTIGLGLLEQEAYPALLQSKIDESGYKFEVVNAGVSGDTSAGGLRRLDWALEGDVKILIVAFGGNDGLRGLPGGADEREPVRRSSTGPASATSLSILAGMEAPPNFGQEYATGFRQAFRDVALQQAGALHSFSPQQRGRQAGVEPG